MCIKNFDITKLLSNEVTIYTPTNSAQECLFPHRHFDTELFKNAKTLNCFPNGSSN